MNVSGDNLIGQTIGDCTVEALIGKGGMARVYRARQKFLDRVVALKVLDPVLANDQGYVNRFLREMKILARLSHPNVVTVYGAGQDKEKGLLYIVMEHVDGGTLGDALQRGGPLPVDRARDYVLAVCNALGYAHSQGLVHRDVKPANVMIDKRTGAVKVMDFGIALDRGGVRETVLGTVMGTYEYMAPEQVEGKTNIDARADIYALGLMFYELLTGRTPYRDLPNSKVIYEKMSRTAPLLACAKARHAPKAQLSELEGFDKVIRSMIQREQGKRPATCAQVARAIAGTSPARGTGVGDFQVTGPVKRRRGLPREIALAALVVALVAVVGIAGWLALGRGGGGGGGGGGSGPTVDHPTNTVAPGNTVRTGNGPTRTPPDHGDGPRADEKDLYDRMQAKIAELDGGRTCLPVAFVDEVKSRSDEQKSPSKALADRARQLLGMLDDTPSNACVAGGGSQTKYKRYPTSGGSNHERSSEKYYFVKGAPACSVVHRTEPPPPPPFQICTITGKKAGADCKAAGCVRSARPGERDPGLCPQANTPGWHARHKTETGAGGGGG